MILECMLLSVAWVDGDCYADDENYYYDYPDQQEHYEQGKYNMGYSLSSYSLFN
jgi:hypothetical protein